MKYKTHKTVISYRFDSVSDDGKWLDLNSVILEKMIEPLIKNGYILLYPKFGNLYDVQNPTNQNIPVVPNFNLPIPSHVSIIEFKI